MENTFYAAGEIMVYDNTHPPSVQQMVFTCTYVCSMPSLQQYYSGVSLASHDFVLLVVVLSVPAEADTCKTKPGRKFNPVRMRVAQRVILCSADRATIIDSRVHIYVCSHHVVRTQSHKIVDYKLQC